MAVTTYAELQTEVADYLGRSDLTTDIVDLITSAEATLNREIRHLRMETVTTLTTTGGDSYVDLPSDFLAVRSLVVTGSPRVVLELADIASLEQEFAASSNTKPTKYAVLGGGTGGVPQLRLGATPDSAYTIDFIYTQKIPALSVSNTSNWLLAEHPDIYIYATLLEAAPYLKDDQRIATWGTLLERALDGLAEESERAKWDGIPSVSLDFSIV